MESADFDPDLPTLLAPVPGADPCGVSLRYEQAYLALRASREEDDPSLPMREWERPLKKADWREVARNCAVMLGRSKDLQLAAWLADAWMRQHQVAGLVAGIDLLAGLVERYWDGLYPRIEDGDSEARTAPFVWLNENLPLALRLHVPLVFLTEHKPPTLGLADWERIVKPVVVHEEGQEPEGLTREAVLAMVDAGGVRWLLRLRDDAREAVTRCDALARALDERLGIDAPSLAKIVDTLRRLERACTSLLDGRGEPVAAPAEPPPASAPPAQPAATHTEDPIMNAQPPAADAAPFSGVVTNREEAYRLLELAATYLQRTEPHSPTPYLVKRAIAWGQMSLPDLMQEMMREEGDLGRFFSMLGIKLGQD